MSMAELLAARLQEDRGMSLPEALKRAERYIYVLKEASSEVPFFYGVDVTHGQVVRDDGKMKWWIDSNFLYVGRPTVVWAATGVGKTHLGSFVALRALDLHPNWDIISNIPWYWADDESLSDLRPRNLLTISSMSELLKLCCNAVLNGRVPAVIIDEMDNAVTSQDWKSAVNKSWKNFSYIERHLEVRGPLVVYHSWNDIPFYMRRAGNVNDFLPPDVHNKLRHVYSRRTKPHSLIVDEDIIPYSSHGEIGFTVDVDMEKLRKRLGATRRLEYARQVRDNIDSCMIDMEESDREDNYEPQLDEKDRKIILLVQEGKTQREITKELKFKSKTSVAYRIGRLRDGGML